MISVQSILKNRFTKTALPFICVVLGSLFCLKQYATLRYDVTKHKLISGNEAEKLGLKMKKPSEITLESEYKKIEELDIDNWEQKRGPRPWEENTN